MLRIRVIPTVLLRNSVLVKSIQFSRYRPIGVPRQAVRVYSLREVDELVLLDIEARLLGRGPLFEVVADLADECLMPLAVGGGVRTLEDIQQLLKRGADKVVLNTEAFNRPEFIAEAAGEFGSQCVVVSIDAKRAEAGWRCEVYTHAGQRATGADPADWAAQVEARGAGEILLTSIDGDGTMQGYDIELIRSVADRVRIPVVASGGAGRPEDCVKAIAQGHASAVAVASLFHFTEVTPKHVKMHMAQAGLQVRT